MLEKWVILNLPRRKDRRVLSVANALRLGVPVSHIELWEAKDNADYEDADAILEAIVADGFTEFKGCRPNPIHTGKNCHVWNVCRFLRWLSTRSKPSMFCHDGIIFAIANMSFCPDWQWFCDVTGYLYRRCKERRTKFKFLQLGHVDFSQGAIPPVCPGSMILDGIISYDNFARIYSPAGAKLVLDRILSDPERYMAAGPNAVLFENDARFSEPDKYWQPPGAFSVGVTIVRDMPNTWLGSDTIDIPMYRQKFGEHFEKDTKLQNLEQ